MRDGNLQCKTSPATRTLRCQRCGLTEVVERGEKLMCPRCLARSAGAISVPLRVRVRSRRTRGGPLRRLVRTAASQAQRLSWP